MTAVSLSREDVPRLLQVSMDRMDAGDLDGAENLARAALEVMPEAVGPWATMAVVTQEKGRKDGLAFEGQPYLERALAIRRIPSLMNDIANCIMYNELRYSEAADMYREAAIRHKDKNAGAHLAICLLMVANETNAARDWRDAWDWYEWRHMKSKLQVPDFEYRGEDVAGKTVLVHFEQGYGDQVFGMRFLKGLHAKGAKVVVLCDWNMVRLVRSQPYVFAAYDESQKREIKCDFEAMLMSLAPYHYKTVPTREDAFIATASPSNRNQKKRVGLCWQGSTGGSYPGWRNVPHDMLRRLVIARPDIEFVSLQHGVKTDLPIDHASIGRCKDMFDTAKLVKTMDLVITSDTMTPHLAAAVGVPVWLMDRWSSSWQWTQTGSRFYDLVRTFRQPKFGDWGSVLGEIARELSTI